MEEGGARGHGIAWPSEERGHEATVEAVYSLEEVVNKSRAAETWQ